MVLSAALLVAATAVVLREASERAHATLKRQADQEAWDQDYAARVLQQRVLRRGIDFEQSIHIDYLDALADSYSEFFHYYDDAPVLIVNAAEIDFANNDEHFNALLEQILQMEGTRQFFNPNPTLL